MRKRILCILLSVVLLLSLIPIGAMPARAVSGFTASKECIDLLIAFEGFAAKPYWDYTQYTVGYGTKCPDEDYDRYMAEGIPEEEAEALLWTYVDAMGASINTFIDQYALNLTQNQFDALLLFSFNCGTAWLYQTGQFRSAVISGATGNDFLQPIALWCNAGGSILEGLIRRRLAEANLYLNGVYSTTVPSNYCYVLYNANGGKTNPRVQAYDSDLTTAMLPTPTYDGFSFDGWYTAASCGSKVTVLDASVRNRTLYAHWTASEGEETPPADSGAVTGTAVDYYREITASSANVMEKPESGANVLSAVKQGQVVRIVAEYTDSSSVKWGQIQNSGWIKLQDTKESTGVSDTESSAVTITVTGSDVNLREGPGTSYAIVGRANKGDQLSITETASGSGYKWGKSASGWIALTYTNYDSVINGNISNDSSTGETTNSLMGTVTAVSGLCIRSGAGTSNSVVGFLSNGTRVEILEQKSVSGVMWGRISTGWISLDYVKLDASSTQTPSTPETPTEPSAPPSTEPTSPETQPASSVMGTVNANDLRIRSGPSTAYSVLGYLNKGDRVEITEQQSSGSMMWGKTEKGWISLTYVDLDSDEAAQQPDTSGSSGTGSTSGSNTVTGKVINTNSLRIRSGPGTNYSIVGYLSSGAQVTITEQQSSGSMMWGKTEKGWISLDYVQLDSAGGSDAVIETGVVTASDCLRIRTGPSTSYVVAGYLNPGEKVEILEKRTGSDGMTWGRTSKGWISLSYVKLDSDASSNASSSTTSQTMTVTADCLRVRSAAGTSNSIVGYLYQGAKVTILETTTVNGTTWGRIEKGWISMDYVK